MLENRLIEILDNLAVLLEIKGENPFKSRAYSNAADIVRAGEYNLAEMAANGTLGNIPGFGKALQAKIAEFYETGKMIYYENLIKEFPEGLVSITKLSGFGPKKTRALFLGLGVKTVDELEQACMENKLLDLKGFGEKFQEEIFSYIQHIKASKGRYAQRQASEDSHELINYLSEFSSVLSCEHAGEQRRFSETVDRLEFLIRTDEPDIFKSMLRQKADFNDFSDRLEIQSKFNIPIILYLTDSQQYVYKLHEKTGNENYFQGFENLLNESGFSFQNGELSKQGNLLKISSEQDLYSAIGIQYIQPELREIAAILEKAKKFALPELVKESDMKGMLHVHSTWSDGADSIREMALTAGKMGYSYIAICDHSRSAAYARGLSIERVIEQHKEIDLLNSEDLGIYIFKGIESDILTDGKLDYPDEILALFDIVVASVHSAFKMNKADMTKRIITALENPYTAILGHPTGRLLLARKQYEIDINEVIQAAAANGKVIEINANPYRLDLSFENAAAAAEKGVMLAVNPDAHSVEGLADVEYGIKVARKACLSSKNIINCFDLNEFRKYLIERKTYEII